MKRYEDKVKEAIVMLNRSEVYHRKGKSAIELASEAAVTYTLLEAHEAAELGELDALIEQSKHSLIDV